MVEAFYMKFETTNFKDDCISGGRYCGVSSVPGMNGYYAVMETLRQVCMFKIFGEAKS